MGAFEIVRVEATDSGNDSIINFKGRIAQGVEPTLSLTTSAALELRLAAVTVSVSGTTPNESFMYDDLYLLNDGPDRLVVASLCFGGADNKQVAIVNRQAVVSMTFGFSSARPKVDDCGSSDQPTDSDAEAANETETDVVGGDESATDGQADVGQGDETIESAAAASASSSSATTTTIDACLLYTSPSPRDRQKSRMPSSA